MGKLNIQPVTSKRLQQFKMLHPKTKKELQTVINDKIAKEGTNCNLNTIDVSAITDMSHLFEHCSSLINLELPLFYTNNVLDMSKMFLDCNSKYFSTSNACLITPPHNNKYYTPTL